MRIKKETLLLALIILAGFALRMWGINFGLPFCFHQDEPIVVNHAMAYGTGDLNPHFFAIPPLTSYLLFIVYGVYFVIGKLFSIFQTANDFALSFLKDPTTFFILGRLFIGAIPGTLCIFFTFRLYKRLFNSQAGALFAASVMAFSFLNIIASHYIYTDMLMSLFIVIGIIRIIAMWENPVLKNYLYAGIAMGIAAGIKYNAALLIVPYIAVHLMARKGRFLNKNLFIGMFLSIAVFIAVNPFSILDFNFFISSVVGQAGASGYIGWSHHIVYSLREGVGFFVLICGFLGMIVLCVKKMGKAMLLLSFPLVFYIHLVFLSQHFPRYVLPLTPFFAITTGYFLFEFILPLLKEGFLKKAAITFCIIPIILLAIKSIKADTLFASTDTRIEAAEWIENNINTKDPIAVDHTFFRPVIYQNGKQLKDKYAILDRQKGLKDIKEKKLRMTLEAQANKRGYYIYYLSSDPESQGQFLSTTPSIAFDYDTLKAEGVKYLVINYYNRQHNTAAFYEELKDNSILLSSFSPYADEDIRFTSDTIATTSMPVSSKELYNRKRSGPAIEIYELKR